MSAARVEARTMMIQIRKGRAPARLAQFSHFIH